jgi:hypothetical protein
MDETVTLRHIVVYLTAAQTYRAYVALSKVFDATGKATVEAWGSTREQAIENLALRMAELGMSFDIDAY